MNLAVFGLWHVWSITAACTAAAGTPTVGIDLDRDRVETSPSFANSSVTVRHLSFCPLAQWSKTKS
jgi:UDP-N-acetyl-D-mannosaminuronate dehydrogenase